MQLDRIKNESQLSEGNIMVKQLEQRRQEIIQILSEEV